MAVRPDPSGPIPEAPVRGAPAARPTGSRFLQMRDARGTPGASTRSFYQRYL